MADQTETIALVGGTLIDGNGGLPQADSVVVLDGERIAAVGGAGSVEIPPSAKVINIAGKTVLPGLIDAHLHVGSSSGGQAHPDEYKPETMASKFKSFLKFGVTAIMDMGAQPNLDRLAGELESGALTGPRLFGVKYGITAPGSHPVNLGKAFRATYRGESNLLEVDTVEEARAAVRQAAAENPAGLKIYHTRTEFPGTMCLDANVDKQKPDVLLALVEEGHAHDLRVFAHTAWPSEAREVIEAGIDVLAHTITHAETGAADIMDMMAERGVLMHTTLTRVEFHFGLKVDPFMREKFAGKIPSPVLDSLGMEDSLVRVRHDGDGIAADARRILEIAMANIKRARKAGVTIVMGTDSGGPGQLHGASVLREMELLNDCGLTAMEVLVASTKHAAMSVGQIDNLGTVEAGKLADLIVIEGDPLLDISNIRNLAWVVKNGTVMDPEEILLN